MRQRSLKPLPLLNNGQCGVIAVYQPSSCVGSAVLLESILVSFGLLSHFGAGGWHPSTSGGHIHGSYSWRTATTDGEGNEAIKHTG